MPLPRSVVPGTPRDATLVQFDEVLASLEATQAGPAGGLFSARMHGR